MSQQKLSSTEKIKTASNGLRGTLTESLKDELTGMVRENDHALVKFHGMYEQDDRDLREERAAKKLDKLYSFMIRLRIPGGHLTPEQYIATHHIAGKYTTGTIKITTRQTIQLHGILKRNIKPTLKDFSLVSLDSIAACGDVNRNVIAASHPAQSPVHTEIHGYAQRLSDYLKPKTRAYYEIWLDEEKLHEKTEDDPLYQDRYLPRKFKIAIAIPPNNDVDVFGNDLGLIAIVENEKFVGFNVSVGGGLGFTHGNSETYPRTGTVIGFVSGDENIFKVVYEIITTQRDFGNRSDRKRARLKYTLDTMGVDTFKAEVEKRCGFKLEAAKPFLFTERKDMYGWYQNHDGHWFYTVFIENGRILDTEELKLKTAMLKIAESGKAQFRFTPNQKLILGDIASENKSEVESILNEFGIIEHTNNAAAVRKQSIACVALNTCPLALAESQRYLPMLLTKMEVLLKKYGLENDEITVRMTGCPNGCGRSTLAEIGFVGTSLGHYNLHLGGDRQGYRLNKKYKDSLNEEQILNELDILFGMYANEKNGDETFGDFIERKQLIPS